jgi:hypothetical protein
VTKILCDSLKKANQQAIQHRIEFETKFSSFEEKHRTLKSTKEYAKQSASSQNSQKLRDEYDEYDEEEALTINDSMNEFNEVEQSQETLELLTHLNDLVSQLDLLVETSLTFDNLMNEIGEGVYSNQLIDILKNISAIKKFHPDHNNNNNNNNHNNHSNINPLDHKSIKIATQLDNNLSYVINEISYIEFHCIEPSEMQNNYEFNLYDYLKFNLVNSSKELVGIDIKEKKVNGKRIIRVYFTPNVIGIYRLNATYDNIHLEQGPFNFMVLPVRLQANDSSNMNEVQMSSPSKQVKSPLLPNPSMNDSNNVFGRGRGRLLRSAYETKNNNRNFYNLTKKNQYMT